MYRIAVVSALAVCGAAMFLCGCGAGEYDYVPTPADIPLEEPSDQSRDFAALVFDGPAGADLGIHEWHLTGGNLSARGVGNNTLAEFEVNLRQLTLAYRGTGFSGEATLFDVPEIATKYLNAFNRDYRRKLGESSNTTLLGETDDMSWIGVFRGERAALNLALDGSVHRRFQATELGKASQALGVDLFSSRKIFAAGPRASSLPPVITCEIKLQRPHRSHHFNRTVNLISTVECTHPVGALAQGLRLFQDTIERSTKTNSNSGRKTLRTQTSALCRDGVYAGLSFASVAAPPNYTPPFFDWSELGAAQEIVCNPTNSCARTGCR